METSQNVRYRYNIPDQVKSGQPEKGKCLQDLITALLDCHDHYKALAVNTQSAELKALYNNYADERADYAYMLYSNLSPYNETWVDENGHVTGLTSPTWSNADIATIYGAVAIFPTIITKERETIKKYDSYLRNHIPIISHLRLLINQKSTIKQTIKFLSESINLC